MRIRKRFWQKAKPPPPKSSSRRVRTLPRDAGQVVIEYVLLIVILAGLGAFFMRSFASRSPDEPGLIIAKWNRLLQTVAQDNPED